MNLGTVFRLSNDDISAGSDFRASDFPKAKPETEEGQASQRSARHFVGLNEAGLSI